jgi:hypothetical protein
VSVSDDRVYRLAEALGWIRAGSFPLQDGRAAFESLQETADFAADVLDRVLGHAAEDLENPVEELDAAGHSILAKRSHRQELEHGAWVESEWPTGCRECGRHCEQGTLVLLRRRLGIGSGVLCKTCGEALLATDEEPLFVPESWGSA